jgi:carboxylate-amine ligase
MRFQFETATAVCTSAEDLSRELTRLRALGAEGARTLGCRLVAAGTAPYGTPGLAALTDNPRYRDLARRYPTLTAVSGTCGYHVHVGVADRDVAAQILARLRPWLATLLAISANSPITGGHDTGWASRRYPIVASWPTARPPGLWSGARAYDRAVRRLMDRGAAVDERSVYFLARISPRYPTVEVRVADVCPDTGTAVLIATLVRALVSTAWRQTRAGVPLPTAPRELVSSSLDAAARNGLAGTGVDPFTGLAMPAWDVVDRLLDHVDRALTALGDTTTVTALLAELRTAGTGSDRQRALWERAASPADVVDGLAAMTLPHMGRVEVAS